MNSYFINRVSGACQILAALTLVVSISVPAQATPASVTERGRDLPAFAELVARHGSVVVNISATQSARIGRGPALQREEEDPRISGWLGRILPKNPAMPPHPAIPREVPY